jgi:transcriptional regulator with XRE-family HTH domain
MAKNKWTEDYFRKRLISEREHRKLTLEQLSRTLAGKGIHLHYSAIAKIERGDRSVRIDEASAIADVFGISVDTMLGRRARPQSDRVHLLIAVADTAIRSAGPIIDVAEAVRDRIADLSPPDDELAVRADLIARCERAHDLLAAVDDELTEIAQIARHAARDQLRAK